MDIFSGAEKLMGMDKSAWARHANPLSVYSRALGAPFVFFAFWSIFWIGWLSALPIAAAIFWVWINPRLFAPPDTTQSWATRGVLGERAYLNRERVPIPDDQGKAVAAITVASSIFFAIAVYGFVVQDFWAAFTGYHAAVLGKIWFVDRMVWLWDQMKAAHPVYQAWDEANWDAAFPGD